MERGLGAARLVLANSRGIAELARACGAPQVRVVHLGADPPSTGLTRDAEPALVTVGHLVARKRHADVLRALAVLRDRHPTLRYVIVGEGPERVALEGLAARLGIRERVQFCGQLPPAEAIERARRCTLFVMPSTEEAFGVAYIEAMAGGLPAIGCRGEPGPEEIAAAGDGFMLVPPGDIERLTQRIDELLSDPAGCARPVAARAPPSPPTSPGSIAASRRSRRTSSVLRDTDEASAVRHRARPLRPGGRLRPAARAGGRRVRALRGPSQHGGRRRGSRRSFPFPTGTCASTNSPRSPPPGATAPSWSPPAGASRCPAAWAGARRAGVPVILWSALWAHPRTAAHAFSYLALRRLYRSAEAIVVYGPHVEAYVRARGARNVHIAPQSVDNEFWPTRHPATPTTPGGRRPDELPDLATPGWPSETAVKFLFAGRPVREKGLGVLIEAWSDSGLQAPSAALVLVGVGSIPPWVPAGGAVGRGTVGPRAGAHSQCARQGTAQAR